MDVLLFFGLQNKNKNKNMNWFRLKPPDNAAKFFFASDTILGFSFLNEKFRIQSLPLVLRRWHSSSIVCTMCFYSEFSHSFFALSHYLLRLFECAALDGSKKNEPKRWFICGGSFLRDLSLIYGYLINITIDKPAGRQT